tara:strand:- start:489 stop:593 length:105 start_codon:yes stop_codon:yes gene_type:complete
MAQISLFINFGPRDLIDFAFIAAVCFTAGSLGII